MNILEKLNENQKINEYLNRIDLIKLSMEIKTDFLKEEIRRLNTLLKFTNISVILIAISIIAHILK